MPPSPRLRAKRSGEARRSCYSIEPAAKAARRRRPRQNERVMLSETADGLFCPAGDVFIDPWNPVKRALITHAHGDHARPGSEAYLCAEATARAAAPALRIRGPRSRPCPTGTPLTIGDVRVSFHPAGHVLGSAQIRIEGAGRRLGRRRATTSARPTRPARRSSRSAATPSSPNRPSACPSTAGTRPTSVIADVFGWWQANAAERRSRRCSSATRSARRSGSWPSSPR